MGCSLSKQSAEVSLCRERTHWLELAVDGRKAFASAQCKYNLALFGVASAINLFVARHSMSSSPFLITFPNHNNNNKNNNNSNNSPETIALDQQTPSGQNTTNSSSSSKADTEKDEEDYVHTETGEEEVAANEQQEGSNWAAPKIPSSKRGLGWDFFDPSYFSGEYGFKNQSISDEARGKRVVSDEEKAGDGDVNNNDNNNNNSDTDHEEINNDVLTEEASTEAEIPNYTPATDTTGFLEALKDVEALLLRAYNSGLEVSQMLETNPMQPAALQGIKENSRSLSPPAITRSRSTSSTLSWASSSRKSLLSSSSRSSSRWTHDSSSVLGDNGARSVCHSLILKTIYEWEKRLYKEVKAASKPKQIYEQKRSNLGKQEAKGDGFKTKNKEVVEMKDMYSRVFVNSKVTELFSKKIEELRDQNLQPQLVHLLRGLMRNWKTMAECHEAQTRIMCEVTSLNSTSNGHSSDDAQKLAATLKLEAEVHNWRSCFASYVSSQKAYIEALAGWSKFPLPSSTAPLSLEICSDWAASMDNLPDKAVGSAMEGFGLSVRALMSHQDKEHRLKRSVDGLVREHDRRVLALERRRRKNLGFRSLEQEMELEEMKEKLDVVTKKIDAQKKKHIGSLQDTYIAADEFRLGFSGVFKSLAEFSVTALNMYGGILKGFEN